MKRFLTILTCAALLTNNVYGETYMGKQTLKAQTLQDANFLGSANLTDVKARSLSILGALEFRNLMVDKDADIAGPVTKSEKGIFGKLSILGNLEATDITCHSLSVAGTVTVTGLTVNGDANIAGSLTLKAPKDPKITKNKLQNLNIYAEEISLEDTEVTGSILVKKISTWLGGSEKQVLRLAGKTTVKGTITFESGKGVIEQSQRVKVEGKITGATIEQK